jgi:3-isopropylmalate dehydratase small subunit
MIKIMHQQIQQEIKSIPAILDIDNIDTDMIIPKQFLKTITRVGLGKYLFYEKRYNVDGSLNMNFALNKYPANQSQILITSKNFGCGSSREHAPWALKDFGIKIIIAESFADIFYNNCFENQILPITILRNDILQLIELQNQMEIITIDIENQMIKCKDLQIHFGIDVAKKYKIVHNLDQIGETLLKIDKITAFEKNISYEFVF